MHHNLKIQQLKILSKQYHNIKEENQLMIDDKLKLSNSAINKCSVELLERKTNTKQLLNIIIIRKTTLPFESFISEFDNFNVTISLLSTQQEQIEHYNINKYNISNENFIETINDIIFNDLSEYYCIMFDDYYFEHNFINKLCKELDELYDINSLLLLNDKENINITDKIEYFILNTQYLRTHIDSYICIFNKKIKKKYTYSMTNIGLILYINEIINKDTILTTTDFKFKSVDTFSDKSILNYKLYIFNIYI